MDNALLEGFIAQAESCLPTIRSGILVAAQTGNIYGELNASLRGIISLKNAASIVALDGAAQIAAELEGKLAIFAELKMAPTDGQSRDLLDRLAELETIVVRARFESEDFADHLTDFVEQSFENLGLSEPIPVQAREEAETAAEEEFEIDAEMMEIFGEEAEEIISSIGANLKILEENSNHREALLEIRRNAHTLKGSAGIVGLKTLSETAHRVEDLLDYIADNEIEAGNRIFKILHNAADLFSILADGEHSPQLAQKINLLYKDFDSILNDLQTKRQPEEIPVRTDDAPAEKEAQPILNAAAVAAPAETQNVPAFPENHVQNRSIVRVSMEKLDDLVKIMSGLVVSRSVFEQRLAELERQIGDLQNTTRRLQKVTNKIEVDFEARTLVGGDRQFQPVKSGIGELKSPVQPQKFFDALELDHYTEFHQIVRELLETTGDTSAITLDLDNLKGYLETLFDNQRRLIEEMQDKLLHLRMVSFGSLTVRLQRTVRVTADEEGKSAELVIEGENLEIDTQTLDSLIEPLLHLLRNAVAHGIESPETRRLLGKPETGRIKIRVRDEETHIILTVSDDGRGISTAALKAKAVQNGIISRAAAEMMSDDETFSLIYLAGLTTTEEINQVSGRGVGMNVVKTAIARQQGTISIASETHQGTTFTVRLPMQTAVTNALLVKSGGQTFAFPLKLIKYIRPLATTENSASNGKLTQQILRLNALLGMPDGTAQKNESASLLIIETPDVSCQLIVDEIVKSEEVTIRSLGNPLQKMPELLGATILGDGSVVPVLDLVYLLKQKTSESFDDSIKDKKPPEIIAPMVENHSPKMSDKLSVMIVDDSPSVRHLTSNIIKNAGWTVVTAKDGIEALEFLQTSRELPDVILSDVEMPRMNGYELLSSLKKQKNLESIPVVMITSRANQKHRQKAFDLGVSEYLTKPFDDAKLIETVKNLAAETVQGTKL